MQGSATISFSLPRAADVKLSIVNALGEEIATLASGHLRAGEHSVRWSSGTLPAGIYFVQLRHGASLESTHVEIVR